MYASVKHAGKYWPDQVIFGFAELGGDDTLNLPYILQLARGADDRVDIKCALGQLLQLRHDVVIDVEKVEFEERLFVHLVWGVQVSEEAVDLAIGEDRDSGCRNVEVAEELAGVVDIQWLADLLAFDQDLDLPILEDGIVDLLAFLGSDVTNELGNHFCRVEDVVAEHALYEGHDKGVLGSFFGLNDRLLLTDLRSQTGPFLLKLHHPLLDTPVGNPLIRF